MKLSDRDYVRAAMASRGHGFSRWLGGRHHSSKVQTSATADTWRSFTCSFDWLIVTLVHHGAGEARDKGKMASHGPKTVIYAALASNILIAILKLAAAWFTGSAAMLSEAVHSLVDTGNQGLLLHGMRQAAKAASAEHPFGHGLQLYFWTFIVAILIFGLGAGVAVREGIEKIVDPRLIESPWANYGVLVLSAVFEGITWLVALRAFRAGKGPRRWVDAIRSSKDPTVFTVLFEDTAALLGLLVAAAGIVAAQVLDLPIMDGVASVIIGLLLAITAGLLAYESQSLLTGEGVQPEIRASMRRLAEMEPGVVRLNELLTMHFGPQDVLVALSSTLSKNGAVFIGWPGRERLVRRERSRELGRA